MIQLLVDVNLDGHAALLDMRLDTVPWREFRDHLDVRFLSMARAGLERTAKDDDIWRLCQQHGYYLLTANRNLDGEDSLEATIRREGKADSLPVFTLADPDQLYQSTAYIDRVVQSLLQYLLNEGACRGAGRLYLP